MLSIDVFLTKFPEFDGRVDDDVLLQLIEQIELETNQYSGLNTEALQLQAIALRVAFEVESIQPLSQFTGGNIKRLESFEDVIEYAVNNIDKGDFKSNYYGIRLERLLKIHGCSAFSV